MPITNNQNNMHADLLSGIVSRQPTNVGEAGLQLVESIQSDDFRPSFGPAYRLVSIVPRLDWQREPGLHNAYPSWYNARNSSDDTQIESNQPEGLRNGEDFESGLPLNDTQLESVSEEFAFLRPVRSDTAFSFMPSAGFFAGVLGVSVASFFELGYVSTSMFGLCISLTVDHMITASGSFRERITSLPAEMLEIMRLPIELVNFWSARRLRNISIANNRPQGSASQAEQSDQIRHDRVAEHSNPFLHMSIENIQAMNDMLAYMIHTWASARISDEVLLEHLRDSVIESIERLGRDNSAPGDFNASAGEEELPALLKQSRLEALSLLASSLQKYHFILPEVPHEFNCPIKIGRASCRERV